jgi:hypothetical protein
MKTLFVIIILGLCLFSSAGYACSISEKLRGNPGAAIDCPDDVATLADNMVMCIHWGGEDAYDEERRKMIQEGREKSRCDEFPCDVQDLRKKYASQPEIKRVIDWVMKEWTDVYGEEEGSRATCRMPRVLKKTPLKLNSGLKNKD